MNLKAFLSGPLSPCATPLIGDKNTNRKYEYGSKIRVRLILQMSNSNIKVVIGQPLSGTRPAYPTAN